MWGTVDPAAAPARTPTEPPMTKTDLAARPPPLTRPAAAGAPVPDPTVAAEVEPRVDPGLTRDAARQATLQYGGEAATADLLAAAATQGAALKNVAQALGAALTQLEAGGDRARSSPG